MMDFAAYYAQKHFIGVFRRGNKPPVLLGEDKKLKHMQIKPPEI